jgi:four helix bundle protein
LGCDGACASREVDAMITTKAVVRMATFYSRFNTRVQNGGSARGFKTRVQDEGSRRGFKTRVQDEGSSWHLLCFLLYPMARSFRELVAWQLAFELNERVQKLIKSGSASKDFKFRDQLADSARSAPRNIAEGFGRFNPTEIAQFVDYARGSLDETENHLRTPGTRTCAALRTILDSIRHDAEGEPS